MKAIDKFGSWILDSFAGMVFGITVLLIAASIAAYFIFTGPKSVTITSSEFTCVDTEPFGISARCVAYRRIR